MPLLPAFSGKLLDVVQAPTLRGRLCYEAGACHLVVNDHLHTSFPCHLQHSHNLIEQLPLPFCQLMAGS